jgi:hypothetical protein
MRLNIEAMERQGKVHNICEIKQLKTVEGKYKMLICENKKINNKSE